MSGDDVLLPVEVRIRLVNGALLATVADRVVYQRSNPEGRPALGEAIEAIGDELARLTEWTRP